MAIVGSILLAFAIDAWWDERQERSLEAEYLEAIIDEIDRNLAFVPGNRSVWERSYSDLLQARDLLRSGAYVDKASTFIMTLNRGLIYGVPRISTAVFDDLNNSGRMVLIEDLSVRSEIMLLYAGIEAEVLRFARSGDQALKTLVDAHTPPGIISQVGPQFSFDESEATPAELLGAAQAIWAEEYLPSALNAELRRRENERAFLDVHERSLQEARQRLAAAIPQGIIMNGDSAARDEQLSE